MEIVESMSNALYIKKTVLIKRKEDEVVKNPYAYLWFDPYEYHCHTYKMQREVMVKKSDFCQWTGDYNENS